MRAREFIVEDVENYGGIDFDIEIERDEEDEIDNIYVKALANGRELGHVLFTISYDSEGMVLNPQDLEVDERYRGQGIASTMYDYMQSKGYRIRRSGQQTDAGAGLWDKYKPGKNIWEQGVAENFADGKQFRVTKQKNGFKVDLYVDGKHAGQYTHTRNEDDVRNFAEIFPEFRNKGHGGMLLLKAIDTADKLGMDFEEDSHSLTPAMSRLYDTLDSEGMIYGGGGAWAISPTGEDALDEYLNENFADGKVKGKSRPGRVKRAGASCSGSVSSLRAKAKKYSGERGKMYHWCANMKSGRNKK